MKSLWTSLLLMLFALGIQAQPNWRRELSNVSILSTERPRVIQADFGRTIAVAGPNCYKLDVSGNIIWQKRFGAQMYFNEVILLEDGNILVVGRERRTVNTIQKDLAIVLKLNPNGNVIWNKTFVDPSWQIAARCCTQGSDGSLYVGGWRATQLGGTGGLSPMILKLDLDGNLIFGHFTDGNTSIASLITNDQGEIFGVGSKNETAVGISISGYFSYFKLDANGIPLWWKDGYVQNVNGSAIRIRSDEPGHYFIAGTVNTTESIIIGIDEDGQITHDAKFASLTDIRSRDLILEEDGGFQLLTTHKFNNSGDGFWKPMVIRLNSALQLEAAINLVQNDFTTLEAQGIALHDDGTAIIHCTGSPKIQEYKLREDVNVVGCGFSQTTPIITTNNLIIEDSDELETFALDLEALTTSPPTNGVLANVFACGSELCAGDVEIDLDEDTYCEGQPFVATTDAGYETYIWYVDEEIVGDSQTLETSYDEWGFYSLIVDAYDEYYCYAVDTVDLVIIPSPEPVLTQVDSVSICSGAQLQVNLTEAYSSYLWSNGSDEPFIFVGDEDWYSVVVTAANGCAAESDPFYLEVFPTPSPTINVIGETEFCDNDNTSLGTQMYSSYEWSNGLVAQFIVVDEPGTYYVTVTNSFGCSAQSAGVTLSTLPAPNPMVLYDGELDWCEGSGGSVDLWTDASYSSVLWNVGGETDSITVSSSAIVWYDVVDSLGCTGTSNSVFVIEWSNPSIVVDEIVNSTDDPCDGSIDISVFAETIDYDIVWTQLPGEDGLTVSGLCVGDYEVVITDANGCSSNSVISVDEFVGLADYQKPDITLYPNPVNEVLWFSGIKASDRVVIYNAVGELIVSCSGLTKSIDVSALSQGTYLMLVIDSNGQKQPIRFSKL